MLISSWILFLTLSTVNLSPRNQEAKTDEPASVLTWKYSAPPVMLWTTRWRVDSIWRSSQPRWCHPPSPSHRTRYLDFPPQKAMILAVTVLTKICIPWNRTWRARRWRVNLFLHCSWPRCSHPPAAHCKRWGAAILEGFLSCYESLALTLSNISSRVMVLPCRALTKMCICWTRPTRNQQDKRLYTTAIKQQTEADH